MAAAARLRLTKAICAGRIAGLASRRGDWNEAVIWGRRAVDCDPQAMGARIVLARALSNADQAAEARGILTELRDYDAPADVADRIREAMGFSAARDELTVFDNEISVLAASCDMCSISNRPSIRFPQQLLSGGGAPRKFLGKKPLKISGLRLAMAEGT
jgi:hypothetical protein